MHGAWQPPTPGGPAEQAAGLRDEHGRLYLPAEALGRHVRRTVGTPISRPALRARMREVGWERRQIPVLGNPVSSAPQRGADGPCLTFEPGPPEEGSA